MNEAILWMIGITWTWTTVGAVWLGVCGKEFTAAALVTGGVFMTSTILTRAWERPCDCEEEETDEGGNDAL